MTAIEEAEAVLAAFDDPVSDWHPNAEHPEATGPTTIRPFHQTYPGMPQLFHTYCAEHPEFGTCAEREQAEKDVAKHLATEHPEPPSDAEMWRTQCKVARQQCIEWELAFSAAEAKLARIADALRADERSSVRVAMALAILNDKEADRG